MIPSASSFRLCLSLAFSRFLSFLDLTFLDLSYFFYLSFSSLNCSCCSSLIRYTYSDFSCWVRFAFPCCFFDFGTSFWIYFGSSYCFGFSTSVIRSAISASMSSLYFRSFGWLSSIFYSSCFYWITCYLGCFRLFFFLLLWSTLCYFPYSAAFFGFLILSINWSYYSYVIVPLSNICFIFIFCIFSSSSCLFVLNVPSFFYNAIFAFLAFFLATLSASSIISCILSAINSFLNLIASCFFSYSIFSRLFLASSALFLIFIALCLSRNFFVAFFFQFLIYFPLRFFGILASASFNVFGSSSSS